MRPQAIVAIILATCVLVFVVAVALTALLPQNLAQDELDIQVGELIVGVVTAIVAGLVGYISAQESRDRDKDE